MFQRNLYIFFYLYSVSHHILLSLAIFRMYVKYDTSYVHINVGP